MHLFTKHLSKYLIISLLAAQFLPLVSIAEIGRAENQPATQVNQPSSALPRKATPLPPFPEDLKRQETDWASVDWDREVILPKDEEAYYKEVQKLTELGRAGEVQTLAPKVSHLYDEEIMRMYRVP